MRNESLHTQSLDNHAKERFERKCAGAQEVHARLDDGPIDEGDVVPRAVHERTGFS